MDKPLPQGRQAGDLGDCDNPRTVTIHITEDRWGNHDISLHEGGVTRKLTALRRGTAPVLSRKPFWDPQTLATLAMGLRELGAADVPE